MGCCQAHLIHTGCCFHVAGPSGSSVVHRVEQGTNEYTVEYIPTEIGEYKTTAVPHEDLNCLRYNCSSLYGVNSSF